MRCRLSRCAPASIATPPPLSPRQRLSYCASLMPVVGCCIVTSLAAPTPLSLHRHLSCGASIAPTGCCFAKYLDVPPSLLSRRLIVVVVVIVILGLDILSCGHSHLSRCAVTSLVVPPPLSPRRRHYRRANACLIAPLSCQWLVVASSPLLPRRRLSRCVTTSLVALPPLLWHLHCARWLALRQIS